MKHTSLVSTDELAQHLEDQSWLIVDCSFLLADPDQEQANYLQSHIPGAIYAHLDRDLSGTIIPGLTGRHPLPTPEEAARRFGSMGIEKGKQVVVYDKQSGALAAARLWWMLRWLGHDSVAVLDGGFLKWLQEGRAVLTGRETLPACKFDAHPRENMLVATQEVNCLRLEPAYRLIDVRAPERYRGEIEPIDPVAGHIPCALNLPYMQNLTEENTFRPPQDLRTIYREILGDTPSERVVFYCGSGVTSAHSLLALHHAGLGEAKLYPGSWSEWIASKQLPVASGANPF